MHSAGLVRWSPRMLTVWSCAAPRCQNSPREALSLGYRRISECSAPFMMRKWLRAEFAAINHLPREPFEAPCVVAIVLAPECIEVGSGATSSDYPKLVRVQWWRRSLEVSNFQ